MIDGKAGNLLYLPLDKLISTPRLASTEGTTTTKKGASQDGDSKLLFDGREITRPTERLGRSD